MAFVMKIWWIIYISFDLFVKGFNWCTLLGKSETLALLVLRVARPLKLASNDLGLWKDLYGLREVFLTDLESGLWLGLNCWLIVAFTIEW